MLIAIDPLAITSSLQLAPAYQGVLYSATLTATGVGAITWTVISQSLPPGLTLSGNTISGTPTTNCCYTSFTVRATDSIGQTSAKMIAINVQSPLVITTTTLPESAVMESGAFCLGSLNGTGTRTWTVVASSPAPGIALQANGCNVALTATGTFTFTAQVTDTGLPPQVATKDFTVHVSAREQQSGTQNTSNISFGGPAGRRLAQTVTVGANGILTGFGFNSSVSCVAAGAITVAVQRLTLAGVPDGNTIATGSSSGTFNGVPVTPAIPVGIDDRLAFVLTAPASCTIASAPTFDSYQAGDAYIDSGSGWVPLSSTDGRYDIPFRTLIQPATPVTYLNANRGGFGMALLNTGKVLLAGGNSNTAEIYDPVTTASTTTGSMAVSRQNHSVTPLADGKVLVAGGRDQIGNRLSTAEVYDPASGTFSATVSAMSAARESHTATRLNDGRVLIAGGMDNSGATLQSAEIYDPITRTFSAIAPMTTTRQGHAAVLLGSGRVLLVGGFNNGSSMRGDLFDPASNTFTATAGQMAVGFRGLPTATVLTNGRVLITGGYTGINVEARAETYDPLNDSFTITAGAMTTKRFNHTATLLADGSVLIAAGNDQPPQGSYILELATLDRYLPASNAFVPAGGLEARRQSASAIRLNNGQVLIAGGFGQSWMTGNTGELYDVTATPSLTSTTLPDGQIGVAYANTTLVATGGSGGPYHIDRISGVLPSGLQYNASAFTLSGTPNPGTTGVYTLGMKVTDSAGHANVQTLTLRIGVINIITTALHLADAAFGAPYRRDAGGQRHSANRMVDGAGVVEPASRAVAWRNRSHRRHSDVVRFHQFRRARRRCHRTGRFQNAVDQCSQSACDHDVLAARQRPVRGLFGVPRRQQRQRRAHLERCGRITATRGDAADQWLPRRIVDRRGHLRLYGTRRRSVVAAANRDAVTVDRCSCTGSGSVVRQHATAVEFRRRQRDEDR